MGGSIGMGTAVNFAWPSPVGEHNEYWRWVRPPLVQK